MIRLEHFQQDDFAQLIEWIHTEELLNNWSGNLFDFPLTTHSLEWYIEDTNIVNESDSFVFKAIDEAGNSIGHISLSGISWKNRSARISRVIVGNNTQRGKGCCQDMVKAVLKIAFEELKLHRVSLGVYDNNQPALKCYEKAGLTIEGIHRDILWKKGSWLSMVEMSILEKEWSRLNKG